MGPPLAARRIKCRVYLAESSFIGGMLWRLSNFVTYQRNEHDKARSYPTQTYTYPLIQIKTLPNEDQTYEEAQLPPSHTSSTKIGEQLT